MAVKEEAPVLDKNRHVREYLAHYISFPHSPRYAVLLNGTWGIGKTFLVKKFLKEHFGKNDNYIYVSLYGLTSIDEIDAVLFQAMYPALGWKGTKLVGRAAKTALKFFRLDPDLKVGEVLSKFDARLYVFDDLERCEMPINKVLGYINEFVEHDGCKVLIVANEAEILNGDEYRRRREKLIGKTLEVQSAFDEALRYFTSLVDDPGTKLLLEAKADEISAVYHQSELNNLRILQQTMWDFERLFRVLTDRHRQNDKAMTDLLRLLFALSFELKAGRIQVNDLTSRLSKIVASIMARRENAKPTPLMVAGARYPEIDLHDDILPDQLLVDILVKGIIDEDEIRASLDLSPHFVAKGDEPSWRAVWHYFERTDNEFAEAYKQMETQFAAREFRITGEILHVFGLQLWLAEIGVSGKTRADVVSEAKQYVDDMYAQNRLEPLPLDTFDDVRSGGYGGLGIHENETAEFQELFAYLREKRNRASEDRYPAQAADLLKEMESDPELYFRHLSDENIYCRVPVLASIGPNTFVSTLLKLHPEHQRIVMMAFKSRYDHGSLDRELAAEKCWLGMVRDRLMKAADDMPPIGKFRLAKYIEWNIEPALK